MWNKEELEWINTHRSELDRREISGLYKTLPALNESREKLIIMICLFTNNKISGYVQSDRLGLLRLSLFTDVFGSRLAKRISSFFISIENNKESKENLEKVEKDLIRYFSNLGIDKKYFESLLKNIEIGFLE